MLPGQVMTKLLRPRFDEPGGQVPASRRRMLTAAAVILGFIGVAATRAEGPAIPLRLRPEGIEGALLISGGDKIPEAAARKFIELAGGAKASIVVLVLRGADREAAEADAKLWRGHPSASVRLEI